MRYYFYTVVELLKLLWQWLPHDGVINTLFRRKPYANKFFTGELLPLAKAIKGRNRAKIRRLAQQLPNIDACGRDAVTPLAFAVMANNPIAVAELMALGANPYHYICPNPFSRINPEGMTIGYVAMRQRQAIALKALFDAGVDPNSYDAYARPLLFDVPDRQDSNAIDVLLDYGANVNVTDKFGQTPLFDMLHAQFDNALLCLQRGANVHQMSDSGVTIPYIVQQALADMDTSSPVYRTMLAIKRLVVEKGGEFPALTPYGERVRHNIVFCEQPHGYRPACECQKIGHNRLVRPPSDEIKRHDEQLLLSRYGIRYQFD